MRELTLVLVRPFLGHVVRSVRGAGREIHEEGLVGHERLLCPDPVDGVISQVLGEVVALLGRLLGLDRVETLIEGGVPLIVLASDEAVEVLETASA